MGTIRTLVGRAFRLSLLFAFAVSCSSLAGQATKPYRYNGSGYITFGAGTCNHRVTNISVGGGGDAFLWRGLTLGGDIGYFRFVEGNTKPFGIATLNVGYHFVDRVEPRRIEPFASVGVLGAAFAGGATPAASLGGGLNYWLKPRIGIRSEVRVTGFEEEAIVMFRIGLSFR
jgi:hypothetical protein